jgi:hypothetical protein
MTFFSRHGHVFSHAVSFVALALIGAAGIESRWHKSVERKGKREMVKSKGRAEGR